MFRRLPFVFLNRCGIFLSPALFKSTWLHLLPIICVKLGYSIFYKWWVILVVSNVLFIQHILLHIGPHFFKPRENRKWSVIYIYILSIGFCCLINHKAISWIMSNIILVFPFIFTSVVNFSTLDHLSILWECYLFFLVWNNIVFHTLRGVLPYMYTP